MEKIKIKRKINLIIIFNIFLIASIILSFIVYTILKGVNGREKTIWLGINILILFGFFCVFNITYFAFEAIIKIKIEKKIKEFINAKQFDQGIQYLTKISKKSYTFSINQRIIYYFGYFELLLNRVDNAIEKFKNFDLKKQYILNTDCYILTIFFLFLIYYIENDKNLLDEIILIYNQKKKNILKIRQKSKNREIIIHLFGIIDSLNDNNVENAISMLKGSYFSNIPFIKKFIEAHRFSTLI